MKLDLPVDNAPPAVQFVPSYSAVVVTLAGAGLSPPQINPAVKTPPPPGDSRAAGDALAAVHAVPSYSLVLVE